MVVGRLERRDDRNLELARRMLPEGSLPHRRLTLEGALALVSRQDLARCRAPYSHRRGMRCHQPIDPAASFSRSHRREISD
jgi:hypothetical protein